MGKGHRRCEICGMKEAWQTGNKLLYSKFPLDLNRCREWLKAVGNEELVHLPIEKLHDQRNVCADHFGKKDFNKKGNRLKRRAIPTLNLKALPLTDAQLAEFPQYMYKHSESKELNSPATEQKENIQEVQSDDCSISEDYTQPKKITDAQNVTSPKNDNDDNDGAKDKSQDDTDISQFLLQQNHNKRKVTQKNEEENTHNSNTNERSSKKTKIEHVDEEVNDPLKCIHCISDKELDKRNDYFGNLLTGELQHLTPCMRSEAYNNILNYVRSLKHKHRK